MKKKWIFIGIAVVVAVAVAVCALLLLKKKKEQPGIHLVDGDLYGNLNGTGYAFLLKDGKLSDGECEGETQVVVKGSTNSRGEFEGTLSVPGFPITESGTISGAASLVEDGNGFYELHYNPVCTHDETVEVTNGEGAVLSTHTGKETHSCNYQYIYRFYPEEADFAVVYVYDIAKSDYYCVVVADSEAQARERFQWMKNNE